MINNKNYAEVSRVLGQSETDKQLAFLGKALCEALPQLKNDPNFTSASCRRFYWQHFPPHTHTVSKIMGLCGLQDARQ